MKLGSVDINEKLDWSKWPWPDFLLFYENSLKGHVKESPEQVAKLLGVIPPLIKLKVGND